MLFKYKALKNNKVVTEKIEANSEEDTVLYLKNNGYFPIEITPINANTISIMDAFNRVGFNDIVNITRQLSIMLNAGLTLIDCFDILKKQTTKPAVLKLLEDIDREIKGGKSFSFALRQHPEHFSNLYIALVRAGEASGKLDEILLKLAENLEKRQEFLGKIRGALVYPLIVVIGMFAVIFIMITFVVPRLLSLYNDFNITLPISTQILIAVSNFSATFWPLIIAGLAIGVVFFLRFMRTKRGQYVKDTILLKIPLINNVVTVSALVDSTRTLSILIGAGVSILEALEIVIETSSNVYFQQAFVNVNKEVEKGTSIGKAMNNQKVFPPILVQMTNVGEQTGHLDETLFRISRYFESESENAVKTLTTLIEPSILVFLGLGVGFLVMSVISPIYTLTSSFQ